MTILLRITCCISAQAHGTVRALIPTHTQTHERTRTRSQPHKHKQARTHTHKYVTFIDFPQQQWFREHASVLCYTYIASIFSNIKASNWT